MYEPKMSHNVGTGNWSIEGHEKVGQSAVPRFGTLFRDNKTVSPLNEWMEHNMNERCRNVLGCRRAKRMIAGFRPVDKLAHGKQQNDTNSLVGILTGHSRLRRHL